MIDQRMRRTGLGVALAGVALAAAACSSPTAAPPAGGNGSSAPTTAATSAAPEPSATRTATATPEATKATTKATTKAAGASAVLDGKRQIWLLPALTEGTLAVSRGNKVELSDNFGDSALFVLVPTSSRKTEHLIKTGKLRSGGEALCLRVTSNGSKPLSLVATGCDTRDAEQRFKVESAGKTESGKPAFRIQGRGGVFLQADNQAGVFVQEVGDGSDWTRFQLVDKGAAALPALD